MSVERLKGLEWTHDGDVHTVLDASPDEVTAALSRLWRRVLDGIDAIPAAQWEAPTRCSEWAVVDIVNHLADMAALGAQAVLNAATGQPPSGILTGFNPQTAPKQLTDAAVRDPDVARARIHAALEAPLAVLDGAGPEFEALQVETPLGAQPYAVALMHVIWDVWLHERDLFLPLGMPVPEREDEARLVALYTLRLAGFFQWFAQREAHVTLALHGATDSVMRLDVRSDEVLVSIVDDVHDTDNLLRGDAVTALDALSGRGDLEQALDGSAGARKALRLVRRVVAGV